MPETLHVCEKRFTHFRLAVAYGLVNSWLRMSQFDYKESYLRNLPHIQPPGATFFVTFRLAGSLPQNVIAQWNKERQWLADLEKANPAYHALVKLNFERAWFAKFESLLDGGAFGPLWLGDDRVAATVAESLHYRDERVYRLRAYSIMRNHVHLVIKLSQYPEKTMPPTIRCHRSCSRSKVTQRSIAIAFWIGKESSGRMKGTIITFAMRTSGVGS